MPSYTARDADRATRLFLTEQGRDDDGMGLWPLEEWLADGPNRFVHLGEEYAATGRPECVVEFGDQVAHVSLEDVGSGDIAWPPWSPRPCPTTDRPAQHDAPADPLEPSGRAAFPGCRCTLDPEPRPTR